MGNRTLEAILVLAANILVLLTNRTFHSRTPNGIIVLRTANIVLRTWIIVLSIIVLRFVLVLCIIVLYQIQVNHGQGKHSCCQKETKRVQCRTSYYAKATHVIFQKRSDMRNHVNVNIKNRHARNMITKKTLMEVWKFQIREGKGKFRPVRLDFLKKGDSSQSEVERKANNKEFLRNWGKSDYQRKEKRHYARAREMAITGISAMRNQNFWIFDTLGYMTWHKV